MNKNDYTRIEKTILNKQKVKDILSDIETYSKGEIEALSKLINKKRRELFKENKYKLGEQSKKLTEEELNKILSFEKNPKLRLAYKIMYYMGLRVSEVPIINSNDSLEWPKLRIHNLKMNRIELRIIPKRLRLEIQNFYLKNYRIIEFKKKGYLFFSKNPVQIRNHLSKDYLRINFSKLVKKANLQKTYEISKDGRKLNLISSHSLRYSFGNKFYEISNYDIEKTRIALRHSDIKSTQIYVKGDINAVNDLIANI